LPIFGEGIDLKNKNLTKADLLDALNTYANANKMALRDKPKNFKLRNQHYPADYFYHKEEKK
jgi:uncharacterized protein YjbI with pentapeptide repeats